MIEVCDKFVIMTDHKTIVIGKACVKDLPLRQTLDIPCPFISCVSNRDQMIPCVSRTADCESPWHAVS